MFPSISHKVISYCPIVLETQNWCYGFVLYSVRCPMQDYQRPSANSQNQFVPCGFDGARPPN